MNDLNCMVCNSKLLKRAYQSFLLEIGKEREYNSIIHSFKCLNKNCNFYSLKIEIVYSHNEFLRYYVKFNNLRIGSSKSEGTIIRYNSKRFEFPFLDLFNKEDFKKLKTKIFCILSL